MISELPLAKTLSARGFDRHSSRRPSEKAKLSSVGDYLSSAWGELAI